MLTKSSCAWKQEHILCNFSPFYCLISIGYQLCLGLKEGIGKRGQYYIAEDWTPMSYTILYMIHKVHTVHYSEFGLRYQPNF